MPEQRINLYEGMILMSSQAATDFAGAVAHVSEVLERVEAEIITLRKWDERRLAYPINGQKRGLYMLTYFKADPSRMVNLERECNLSEQIVRAMFLRADHIGETEIDLEKKEVSGAAEAKMRGGEDAPAESAPAAEAAPAPAEPVAAAAAEPAAEESKPEAPAPSES